MLLADVYFDAAPNFYGEASVQAFVEDEMPRCATNATDGCVRGVVGRADATLGIFVRKRNDPPFVDVRSGAFGAAPDGSELIIRDFAVVGDPDANETGFGRDPVTGRSVEARLTLTLEATRGRVSLASRSPELSFVVGEGVRDRRAVVDGPLSALNAALSVVTYQCFPADGCGLGEDVVTATIDDNGHSGSGGAKTASGELRVTVVGY